MTSAKTYSLLAVAVIAALAGGYWLGRHSQPAATHTAAVPAERKVLYWYDPMTPDQRFDKPGKSPFMDMDLMPRYADEVTDDGGVTVSARQQQNLGMRSEAVQRRVISAPLNVYGTITADERSLRTVAARASGLVEKLYVAASQQQVKKGQKLATLWIPDWTAAQQEYLAVRQLGDHPLSAAARQRLALQFMPEDVLKSVDRTGQPQTRIDITAPEDGYLSLLSVREGAQVTATQPLFELTSLKQVWIVMDYPPSAASQVHAGSNVTAETESQPDERFRGTVSELLPDVDAVSRTLKARVVMDNPQGKLRPGMYLNLTLAADQQTPVLAIPQEALIQTGSRNKVLLDDGNGHFTPQEISTGATRDGWTEVLSGLKEGQRVVTSGQFLIDSEASLRSALPAASASEPAAAGNNTPVHGGHL